MKNEFEVNEVKTDEESYKSILFYCIGYASTKSVKPLYLIINKINGYIEESIGNKYLTVVSTDESKDTLKKYEEIWSKICRDCIRSIRNRVHNSKHNNIKIIVGLIKPINHVNVLFVIIITFLK